MLDRSELAAIFWIGDNRGSKNIIAIGLYTLFHPINQIGKSNFLFGRSESAVADIPNNSLHKQV